MSATQALRRRMVREQLERRGIDDRRVLEAMATVPREAFVGSDMAEFAYEDSALPIAEGQTISQPYIVAVMAQALEVQAGEKVLDVGTGSGYAAAVLAHIADEVWSIERHEKLAERARERFEELGIRNVHVRVGDGTLGWEEHAPFDAIQVAAGGPRVPDPLIEQLAPGGRLVVPTGQTVREQELLRLRRTRGGEIERENLGAVRFVPLIGAAGWEDERAENPSRGEASHAGGSDPRSSVRTGSAGASLEPADRVARAAEPFDAIDAFDAGPLLDRIGDARVVLLGEATHGTSEFYRMRTRITMELVRRKGVRAVALEADWPDAAALDAYVRHEERAPGPHTPFQRFPTWMWANEEVRALIETLREHNGSVAPDDRVGIFGLDLYSLHTSMDAVLEYLEDVDPDAAAAARTRYGCLTPWQHDAAAYGRAVLTGRYRACEDEVVEQLRDLLDERMAYEERSGSRSYLDAARNAEVVAGAERYYRTMYYGGRESWNVRDQHMFDTLDAVLEHLGPDGRAVVWEHNSHVGDARATEMGARGEHNVGQLCRTAYGRDAYNIGFGTDHGTVAAAHDWGDPMEVMDVRPSREGSYERLSHDTGIERFTLPLRGGQQDEEVRDLLAEERLQRAIGVIYRPRTELQSHYFAASLSNQFDEWIWFDGSQAVTPLRRAPREDGIPQTYPFAV